MKLPEITNKRHKLSYAKWLLKVRVMDTPELLREAAELMETPAEKQTPLIKRKIILALFHVKKRLETFDGRETIR